MALFEDMFEGNIGVALLVGIGTAVAAPVLAPVVTNLLRPAAKTVIKGGILAYDQGRKVMAQMSEATSDIAAEARADVATHEAAAEPASPATA